MTTTLVKIIGFVADCLQRAGAKRVEVYDNVVEFSWAYLGRSIRTTATFRTDDQPFNDALFNRAVRHEHSGDDGRHWWDGLLAFCEDAIAAHAQEVGYCRVSPALFVLAYETSAQRVLLYVDVPPPAEDDLLPLFFPKP